MGSRYHLNPGTEEHVELKSEPRLKTVEVDEDFEEFRPIVERDDEPTVITRAALKRLDEAVDDAAEVCEVIGRKSLELRRRMKRKRIDSGQKLAALISQPPPPEAVGT